MQSLRPVASSAHDGATNVEIWWNGDWQRKTESHEENPVPRPCISLRIPAEMPHVASRASPVPSRQLMPDTWHDVLRNETREESKA